MRQTIALATYGGSTRIHEHSECIDQLRHQLGMLVLESRRSCHIDIARSALATAALDNGADVVVFIDHDIVFDALDVEALANVARETRGVVGACYSQRRMGASVVGGFAPSVKEATFFEGGGLYPAAGVVGMGFTAIHRDTFARFDALPQYALRLEGDLLIRPYFEKLVVDGRWLKEDGSFCHMARTLGARTDLDTRIRVTHWGEHPFSIEDCRVKIPRANSLTVRLRIE